MIDRTKTSQGTSSTAFTRLDFLASLAAGALLITIIVPALANSNSRSDRVACVSNLRQIGVGFTQFGLEHNYLSPWWVYMRDGGTHDYTGGIPGLASRNQSYVQFSVLSNWLDSPRYLADPGDMGPGLNPASSWSANEQGGLYHISRRNLAISYFIELDAGFQMPGAVLAGDRNVWAGGDATTCSSQIAPCSAFTSRGGTFSDVAWTNDVHGVNQGNVLLMDGRVQQTTSKELRNILADGNLPGDSLGDVHALFPR